MPWRGFDMRAPSKGSGPAVRGVPLLERREHPRDLGPLETLLPHVLGQLGGMARRQLGREHTEDALLQNADLVQETYLRLARVASVTRRGRAYFFAAVGRAMRQVLIDAARKRSSVKRASGFTTQRLAEASGGGEAGSSELPALHQALRELGSSHPRCARIVQCRFFSGMTVFETATAMRVSPRTVKSDWAVARRWLHDALRGAPN